MMDNHGQVTMNMEESDKYKVGDECKISAMGMVKSIDKKMVTMELKDIEMDNVSEEDDAEAAMSGMTTKQYKGVKKIKNEVKAKHEIV